jgi:hypothetical protein
MGKSMNDLFASIEEAKDERQAIQMADGITTTQDELHRCEVIGIVNRYFPHGDPKPFFAEVEKKRGKESADKLRADCRVEWAKRREVA